MSISPVGSSPQPAAGEPVSGGDTIPESRGNDYPPELKTAFESLLSAVENVIMYVIEEKANADADGHIAANLEGGHDHEITIDISKS